jgi:hypothetical protein
VGVPGGGEGSRAIAQDATARELIRKHFAAESLRLPSARCRSRAVHSVRHPGRKTITALPARRRTPARHVPGGCVVLAGTLSLPRGRAAPRVPRAGVEALLEMRRSDKVAAQVCF